MRKLAKLSSGKLHVLHRKLTMVTGDVISLRNNTKSAIIYEVVESLDGTKPSITIKIKKLLRRKRNEL
jgi:hypothetical protein